MRFSLDGLVRTALLPFLLLQGVHAGRKAGKMPEPDGPRAGVIGTGPPLSILVTGDSSAAGVGADHQDRSLTGHLLAILKDSYRITWRIEAKTGDKTHDTVARLEAATPQPFDLVVVALGVNDVTGSTTLPKFLAKRRRVYEILFEKFEATRIIASGLPPIGHFTLLPQPLRWVMGRQAQRYDRGLAAQAATLGVEYMPFALKYRPELMAKDGFHPAPEAYRLWAEILLRHIQAGDGSNANKDAAANSAQP